MPARVDHFGVVSLELCCDIHSRTHGHDSRIADGNSAVLVNRTRAVHGDDQAVCYEFDVSHVRLKVVVVTAADRVK